MLSLNLNFIFVFLIIACGVFYFYFKFKQVRTRQQFPIRKKMYASISGAALGGLLVSFGINQLILFDGVITYAIAAIFILFGAYVFTFNFRAHKHYKQFVDEEMELNDN